MSKAIGFKCQPAPPYVEVRLPFAVDPDTVAVKLKRKAKPAPHLLVRMTEVAPSAPDVGRCKLDPGLKAPGFNKL